MAISGDVRYPRQEISSEQELDILMANSREIALFVEERVKRHQAINVGQAMGSLAQVGKLLQLAYAGSHDHPCFPKIGAILANYQTLIKNSFVASSTFVEASLKSLQMHSFAIKFADQGKLEQAGKMVGKCAELAKQMAEASETLVRDAEDLCTKSEEAFLTAMVDKGVSAKEKKILLERFVELKANAAFLEEKGKLLNDQLSENQEALDEANIEAKDARRYQLILSLFTAAWQPVTNVAGGMMKILKGVGASTQENEEAIIPNELIAQVKEVSEHKRIAEKALLEVEIKLASKKVEMEQQENPELSKKLALEIAALETEVKHRKENLEEQRNTFKGVMDLWKEQELSSLDKVARIERQRTELQKERMEANGLLAESVEKLKHLSVETEELSTAIASLEVTVQTLGKIKTVFENTRVFWIGVERHCRTLMDIDVIQIHAESESQEDLIKAIEASGFNWIALCRINLLASREIKKVDQGIDNIMNDLPSREESSRLISGLADSMLNQIEVENARLLNTQSDNQE